MQKIFIGRNGETFCLKNLTMHIEINDNTSFRQIQKVFSDFYPYLKMEFYRKRHKKYESSEETDWIDPNTTIGDIKQTHVALQMNF